MLEIGSLIDGKYKILNVVGKGGMSVVYLAMNERANKQWAIKEVRKDGIQNFEVVKQNLIVETDLLKKLDHPHLPSIIDVIDGDGTFLIVMDYIEGKPLSDALKNSGAQSQEDVIEWAKQLCDVLGYLHSRKPPIIYRDMKPSNVMLKPDGNVMLIDFGTAREFKSTSVADTTCLGTQGYAAPEQFGGQGQTDARTDIYCLGATMYHLVTGHNPCTPPYEMYPIRQWNPMLSSGLEEIITKCTQRNPNDRYQSCAELLYALDHYTDLDIENKKVQSFKWKVFITSIILTIVTLIGTLGFSVALSVKKSSTYDYYLETAEMVKSDQDESTKYYLNALSVNPKDIRAYEGMLNLFLDDNVLEESEESVLNKELLLTYKDEIVESEPQEYADKIAYPLAQAFFFAYEPDEGRSTGIDKSVKWFKDVEKYSNNAQNIERSKLLRSMAEYIEKNKSSKIQYNGDPGIDYSEYWKKLKELCEAGVNDNGEIENFRITLLIYRFVAITIDDKLDEFDKAGIKFDAIGKQIKMISDNTEEICKTAKFENESEEQDRNTMNSIDATIDNISKKMSSRLNQEVENE
ncbi:MAG: serine/threonine protein kinase [Ruminococcus sp.]|nr:serine/threonine protein kinase [Ruminococcus sp.]